MDVGYKAVIENDVIVCDDGEPPQVAFIRVQT
jgi:hypothetical protein